MIFSSCCSLTRWLLPLPRNAGEAPHNSGLAALGEACQRIPSMPMTAASGTTAASRPMSVTGSMRHRSASASVCASSALEIGGPVAGGVNDFLAQLEHFVRGFQPPLPGGLEQRRGGEFWKTTSVCGPESRTSAVAAPSSSQ